MLEKAVYKNLIVTSSAFENNGIIPIKYTGRGQDISPPLHLAYISSGAKSIAVIMDDLDIPFMKAYNHWLIWNIPVQELIPEGIPKGKAIASLGDAVQGAGYGKHEYRGPKPPKFIKSYHRYQFHVYVLDGKLYLDSGANKKRLLKAMEGHILQHGVITGKFRNI